VLVSICAALAQDEPLRRAEALIKAGRPAEALPILLQVHRSDPRSLPACQQLGLAYTALQQFANAAEFFRKALQINPHFLPARKDLGTVLWYAGQKRDSEREFASILKTHPDDSVSHLYIGLAEFERRSYAAAKAHFERAGALAMDNPEVVPAVIETYLAIKDFSLPDRLLKQLKEMPRPDSDLLFQLGDLLMRYGSYERAIGAFEKLSATAPAKPEPLLMLAEAYDRQAMPERAYSAYEKAIAVQPAFEESYVAFAYFAATHGNNEFAGNVVRKGLQKIPGSSKLQLENGVIDALAGRRDEAEARFRRAAEADPRWNVPLLALGISQMENGNAADAAATFREAARIAPDDYRAEYLYATALARAGTGDDAQRSREIIAALRRAIALNSQDARPHVSLGQAYAAAGQPDAAIGEFQKALKLERENQTALYQLSLLYRKQGNSQAAERFSRAFRASKAKAGEQESAAVQILKILKEAQTVPK
jgi:tetratricopeptide (TPR) repeat protein